MLEQSDIRRINKQLIAKDESHLWPIRNRFNVTERAIRRVRRLAAQGLVIDSPLEYETILEEEISSIVNNEANW